MKITLINEDITKPTLKQGTPMGKAMDKNFKKEANKEGLKEDNDLDIKNNDGIFKSPSEDGELKEAEVADEENKDEIDETTGASSSGSFAGPAAWAKNPKNMKFGKVGTYGGGTVIEPNRAKHNMGVNSFKTVKESQIINQIEKDFKENMDNYLTNPSIFEDLAKKMQESSDAIQKFTKDVHPEKGKMHKLLGLKPEDKIEDHYKNGESLAKALLAKTKDKKEATGMLAFAANANSANNIFDSALHHVKSIDNHSTVNEERKTSSLVNVDRIKADNKKIFQDDLKAHDDSIAKAVKDASREYVQPESFPDDQKKNFTTIEPKYDEDSLKPKDINKGNVNTDEVEEEIMLNRGRGVEDNDFDIEPSKKYKDMEKRDMGKKNFDNMEKKIEFRKKAPSYNKDPQPITKKIKESISAYYVDKFNKKNFIEIDLDQVSEISKIDESYKSIETKGMGNYFTEGLKESIEKFDFYIDSKSNIVKMNKVSNKLNESTNNEESNKMKHLFGYNPKEYIDSKKSKK